MGPNVLRLEGERALKPGSEFTECSGGCPTLVVVPAGKFLMGSIAGVGLDTEHMMRGGDFFFDPSFLRSGQRYMLPSNFRSALRGRSISRV